MPGGEEANEGDGSKIVLGKDTLVFQRVTPDSSSMFVAHQELAGTEVEIGGPEEVGVFSYDHKTQQFVPWLNSGERYLQYFRLVDLPPMVRLAWSSVMDY